MAVERIAPFQALMYSQRMRGALAQLVAPPYDLVGPARQDELYARSPHNIIRIELNRDPDRYASSAATLAQWLSEGVFALYPKPAIYFYTQRFEIEGRRLVRNGFITRTLLEEFSSGRILPHEKTFPAAKEDRLKLLIATRTNTSSIFGLFSGSHPELERLQERVASTAPLLKVTDDLGMENEIRPVDAPEEIAIVQRSLATPRILIADGHHRYETALNYRRQRRAQDGDPAGTMPYDYTMMTLTATNDSGLVILPTHRVVKRLPAEAIASFDAGSREHFVIEQFNERAAMLEALRAAGKGAIGVALKHSAPRLLRITHRDAMRSAAPSTPPEVRELDVSILHTLLFDRIFAIKPEAVRAGGNIEYTIDASAALQAVERGEADGAFLMNPPSIKDVERVSDAGATMPEKSTYFQPKLLTGLVLNPLSND